MASIGFQVGSKYSSTSTSLDRSGNLNLVIGSVLMLNNERWIQNIALPVALQIRTSTVPLRLSCIMHHAFKDQIGQIYSCLVLRLMPRINVLVMIHRLSTIVDILSTCYLAFQAPFHCLHRRTRLMCLVSAEAMLTAL